MRYFTILLMLCFAVPSFAQTGWKSYRLIHDDKDTINCIDYQDRRQGRWVIKVESLRGEPGYDEEGMYKDGKREGIWRRYSTMGDLLAIERYRWGNKDGKCQYFTITGLAREESWKAVNPENPYDTVDVYDPLDPTHIERKVVKIEGSSVRHGVWKYYESSSGALIKTESYMLGKLEAPKIDRTALANEPADSSAALQPMNMRPKEKVKPKEVEAFEKKTGKKKVKVFDGSTGL